MLHLDNMNDWCLDMAQINGSAVWRTGEQRPIVFGCALKHFNPCLDVSETWLPCNIYACMNIYCESEYACVKEGQMRKNKEMKTFHLNGCLKHWTPRMKIVLSVKYKKCSIKPQRKCGQWGCREYMVVVVSPVKTNINVCGCLCWGQCHIIFHWFLAVGCSVNIALLYQPINHKNRYAQRGEKRGIFENNINIIYIQITDNVISMHFLLTSN